MVRHLLPRGFNRSWRDAESIRAGLALPSPVPRHRTYLATSGVGPETWREPGAALASRASFPLQVLETRLIVAACNTMVLMQSPQEP